jgi:Protein of unknown function (DUF3485)
MRTKAKRRVAVVGVGDATLDIPAAAKPSPGTKAPGRLWTATASPRWWTLIACTILLCSAGIRQWRDLQFSGMAQESAACPFPLSEIPRNLGDWYAAEAGDEQLDPEISRLAGSNDHIIRTYQNESKSETASILVLYGLAESVFGHTPDVCYRAAGYKPETMSFSGTTSEFTEPGSAKPVRYRVDYFSKEVGGVKQKHEVFYTFLHAGEWQPEVASRWKMFRYHPGMFKIQIERQFTGSPDSSPSLTLLKELVEVIDGRVAAAKEQAAKNGREKKNQGK